MTEARGGDILLTAGRSFEDWAIRLAQRRRDGINCRWSHAAVCTGRLAANGTDEIIEAAGRHGVRIGSVGAYKSIPTIILPITATNEQRAAAVRFAESQLGLAYDWADLISIGFNLLIGSPLVFHGNHRLICSWLAAECLRVAGYDLPRDPSDISPGDLAVLLASSPATPHTPLTS